MLHFFEWCLFFLPFLCFDLLPNVDSPFSCPVSCPDASFFFRRRFFLWLFVDSSAISVSAFVFEVVFSPDVGDFDFRFFLFFFLVPSVAAPLSSFFPEAGFSASFESTSDFAPLTDLRRLLLLFFFSVDGASPGFSPSFSLLPVELFDSCSFAFSFSSEVDSPLFFFLPEIFRNNLCIVVTDDFEPELSALDANKPLNFW